MSEEVVQFIIGRAVTDPEFRELLFTNPDEALEGYELSEEEAESLKQIDKDKLEAGLGEMEDRISRAGFSPADFAAVGSFLSSKYQKLNLRSFLTGMKC